MKTKLPTIDLITKYLVTEDNTKEKEMIDKLIQDDEQSRRDFDAYVEVWEKSADLKDYNSINSEDDWLKVRSRLPINPAKKIFPLRYYGLRIAAILVLAIGLVWLFTTINNSSTGEKTNYFETLALNEVKTIELSDGSIINLNKNSKIIQNDKFGTENRDIILEGEAFFEVAHNENLPFRVHTLNSIVEVLGTSFDIKADSDLVVVGVLRGKVAFYENQNIQNRVDLLPQNTGYFNASSKKLSSENSFDANRIAWHSKEFVFRDIPLQNVCSILADYYNMELITAPDIRFIDSVNLTCSTQSLDEILSYINSFLLENIELVTADNKLIVRKQ
jgi:transmembrane sensor